jgi:glycerol-3-phosphate dehydrogenase subunit C
VCPVLAVHPQYPGPKRLGPEFERLRREGISTDTEWVEYCLGCHRCDLACPHQVNVSEMIARAKGEHRKPLIRGLRDWWFARPGLLGKLTTIVPALSNFALSMKPARFVMSYSCGSRRSAHFPSTRGRICARPRRAARSGSGLSSFPDAFIRYNQPDLGRKVIDLLDRNGFAAEVASAECCGVPALANGDMAVARSLARANVRAWRLRSTPGCAS